MMNLIMKEKLTNTDLENIDLLIFLIEEEYPEEDTSNVITLCNLINKEFKTNYNESDIRAYFTVKDFDKMIELTESEEEYLMRKNIFNT